MAADQTAFVFGTETGTEATHGTLPNNPNSYAGAINAADKNVNITREVDDASTFFIRILIQATTITSNFTAQLTVSKNGGAFANVTTTSANVKAVTTAVFADNATTTSRLGGTGTFESTNQGCSHTGDAGGAQQDIVASGNAEELFSVQLVPADLVVGDVLTFRVAAAASFPATPQIAITELVTGTAAGTTAAVTAAASGTAAEPPASGTVAATLAAATAASTGNVEVEGPAAATRAATTAAATGQEIFTGTAAAARQAVTGSATAAFGPTGTVASTLAPVTAAATGQETFTGTAAATLAAATTSASEGAQDATGSATPVLAVLLGQATGALEFVGSAAVIATTATAAVSGAVQVTGTAATALSISASASGQVDNPPSIPPAWRKVRAVRTRSAAVAARF